MFIVGDAHHTSPFGSEGQTLAKPGLLCLLEAI